MPAGADHALPRLVRTATLRRWLPACITRTGDLDPWEMGKLELLIERWILDPSASSDLMETSEPLRASQPVLISAFGMYPPPFARKGPERPSRRR